LNIIPALRTTLDPRRTAVQLDAGFRAAGRALSRLGLELLHAQLFLETGGLSTDYNPGNHAAAGFVDGVEVPRWSGNAWRPPWFATPTDTTPAATRRLHARMIGSATQKPDVPSAFRAYPSEAAGVAAHVDLLLTNFPALVDAAETGDAEAFRLAVITPDPKTKRRYSPDYGPSSVKTLTDLRAKYRAANVFDGLGSSSSGGAGGIATIALLFVLALVLMGNR
jgi:hypothetical protein